MIFNRFVVGLATIALLSPAFAFAADNASPGCLTVMYDRMGHEERMYRSVLFGRKAAADMPEGSVLHSMEDDGSFATWMKTGASEWVSLDEGYQSTTWRDPLMDERADIPVRRGLFEMRKTPTSDLIPPLLQSMRALRCRLRSVCAAAERSAVADEGATSVAVQTDGCLEFSLPVFEACKEGGIATMAPGSCMAAVDAVILRETALLRMVVAYDAAYRSLAQFAGMFEGFLTDFRFSLLQPLWQMTRALGALDGLPCFNAQCDE